MLFLIQLIHNRRKKIWKKNKGFTLIELLAIIVILAIIAVITVPIILDIIENSRRGTAIDSAYGYKDSIQKYYVTKSVTDSTQEAPSGVKYVSELKTDGLTISGQEPTDGWVKLDKGQVEAYSLKFGDYVVTFDESTTSPVSTKNGGLAIATCPGCVFAWYPSSEMKWIKGSGFGENEALGNNKLNESEYYEDYTKLVEKKGKNYFLGHVIDDNNYIIKSYACGIEKGKAFCLEGTSDGSKYSSNVDILISIFQSCDASASSSISNCPSAFVETVRAYAYSYGTAGVNLGSSRCDAYASGNSYCN